MLKLDVKNLSEDKDFLVSRRRAPSLGCGEGGGFLQPGHDHQEGFLPVWSKVHVKVTTNGLDVYLSKDMRENLPIFTLSAALWSELW